MKRLIIGVFLAFSVVLNRTDAVFSAPNNITNLSPTPYWRRVVLTWSAPYDISAGTTPVLYEVRTSTYRVFVTTNDWENNSTETGYPYRIQWTTATYQGFLETLVITGLKNGQTYNFAVRSSTWNTNDYNIWSGLDETSPRPQAQPANNSPLAISAGTLSPVDGSIVPVSTPTFSWGVPFHPAPPADDTSYGDKISSYTVWLSTINDFSIKNVQESIPTTYYCFAFSLNENTTYYWRVFGVDLEGAAGPVSEYKRVIINAMNTPPSRVNLLNPANGGIISTLVGVEFGWSSASDPDPGETLNYTIYYASVANFAVDRTTSINTGTNTYYDLTFSSHVVENATYYWYVRTTDNGSGVLPSTYTVSVTSTVRIDSRDEPPSNFNLITPSSDTVVYTSTPTFEWQNSFDPDPGNSLWYQVRWSSATSDLLSAVYESDTTKTQFIPPTALVENATYWWMLVAFSTSPSWGNTQQECSSAYPWSFIVDAVNILPSIPTLVFPENATSTTTFRPLFDWSDSYDPDPRSTFTYTLFYTSSTFTAALSTAGLTSSKFTPPFDLIENAKYFWKVDVTDNRGGLVSTTSSYFWVDTSTQPPNPFSLISPSDAATVNFLKVNFDWADTTAPDPFDSVSWTIDYSTDINFGVSVSSAGLVVSSWTIQTALINNSTYYWRVKAVGTSGEQLCSETTRVFWTTGEFGLISPSNEATASYLKVSFDWQDITDPDNADDIFVTYQIDYSTDINFAVSVSSAGLEASGWTLQTALTNNTTYYWRVKAVATSGDTLAKNTTWYFYTKNMPPQGFGLISPLSDMIITGPSLGFNWQSALDVESDTVTYTVVYSTDAGFSVFVSSAGLYTTSYSTLTSTLLENYRYFWRVEASDYWNNSTLSNGTSSFFVNITSEPPAAFSLLLPANSSFVSAVNFDWADTSDPDPGDSVRWTLWYSTDPGFNYKKEVSGLSVSDYSVTEILLGQSTYYWKVRAWGLNDPVSTFIWSNETFVFYTPAMQPKEPSGLTAELNSEGTSLTMYWQSVTLNTDGSICDNLTVYKVYRVRNVSEIDTAVALASVSSNTLTYTDNTISRIDYFYFVKAINIYSTESPTSETVFVSPADGTKYKVFLTDDREVALKIPQETFSQINNADVVLQRLIGEETERYLRVYDIKIKSGESTLTSFSDLLIAEFSYKNISGVDVNSLGISWYDGIGWKIIPSETDTLEKTLKVKTRHLSKFRIEQLQQYKEFTLLNWPPSSKIITPNNDGYNDELKMYYVNPEIKTITGRVYDISGEYISELKNDTDERYISWDGRDRDGYVVLPGVYIYQIKIEGVDRKVINGTVVIAR